ncbi:outer membrane beta-barrel protein [Gramella jeungdoensis]|uniref:Outer membrane beta-barrel protein n=1 Tax=Gramella jeungdoensis TaxID=708091 RepID=A0ABT0Z3M9_9FLAO|nr:outer membrane beta-barrel protein [Gramella jeungdoensis]MCM8570346.1 outer membrane beta-barrel protein [Gramella jeungdoensis]
MKFLLFLSFLFLSFIGYSQEFIITGKIIDENGDPLEAATVYLETLADSSLVTYSISEKNGNFRLSGETGAENARLFISFAGYQSFAENIHIKERINLNTVKMQVQENQLDEVLLTAKSPPLSIKRDTLEFNADSFTTRPDANLEELMKKLPGVEVDSDGNITVNGKPVSRILVNGEEFFGDDPKIATKNLPKEIINKIQVTDTKTKTEEFTGKPGDPDNKTVNITIKEDKNKGYFARATAGGGTNERYELSAIANYFKDDLRLSALGSSNNINSSGFSYDEVYGMMGRSAGRNVFGGNRGGITKSETAGLNFVNKWKDKYEVNGDYFFGRNDTESRTRVSRENILPDSTYFTNSEQSQNLINDSHRANLRFEVEFDSLTRLSVRPRFDMNIGESHRNSTAESLNENQEQINVTETQSDEELERTNFSNDIDFIKRCGGNGAFLRLEFSNWHREQKNDNFFYSESVFREEGGENIEIQDQYIDEDEKENSYSFEASNRSVLATDFFLDISYDFDYSNSTNQRYVYEADESSGDYSILNNTLSNDFETTSRRHTPNIGLNYEGEIWRVQTEIGLLYTELLNTDNLQDNSLDNSYNNLYVEAEVRYEVERSKSLSFEYETDVDIPSIRQLQPVEDRTNPLNIVVGNPGLEPSYRQSFGFNYRNFDFETRTGIFTWANLNLTDERVVSVTTLNEDLVRTTTFTNVDGTVNASVGAFYNKQTKKEEKEFRYRMGLRANYDKNVGFTNGKKYEAYRYRLNPSVRFTYAIEDLIDINPNYNITYNETRYDINPDRNENFIDHRAGLEITSYWPENVIFGNDISFNYFGIASPGFKNSSWFWNMSLGYQFMEDDTTIKLKVYDVLDQNIDTRRTIGDDFVQDTSSLILTRYAMLSFTYKLDKFGGKNSPNNRRR